jgi:hypothetical protein
MLIHPTRIGVPEAATGTCDPEVGAAEVAGALLLLALLLLALLPQAEDTNPAASSTIAARATLPTRFDAACSVINLSPPIT